MVHAEEYLNDLNESIIIKAKYMYCEIEDASQWCRQFSFDRHHHQWSHLFNIGPDGFLSTNTHVSSVNAYVSNLILTLRIALTRANWCQLTTDVRAIAFSNECTRYPVACTFIMMCMW